MIRPVLRRLRRKDGPPVKRLALTVPVELYEAVQRAALADGLATATFAAACLERGLPLEAEVRRKRRARAAGRGGRHQEGDA